MPRARLIQFIHYLPHYGAHWLARDYSTFSFCFAGLRLRQYSEQNETDAFQFFMGSPGTIISYPLSTIQNGTAVKSGRFNCGLRRRRHQRSMKRTTVVNIVHCFLFNDTNRRFCFPKFIFVKKVYMFRPVPLPIISDLPLHIRNRYMSSTLHDNIY
jgi:hypothetical protein